MSISRYLRRFRIRSFLTNISFNCIRTIPSVTSRNCSGICTCDRISCMSCFVYFIVQCGPARR